MWTYYLLVLFSLTGLSTLLGQTQVKVARDEERNTQLDVNQPLSAAFIDSQELVVDPCILQYIQRQQHQQQQQEHGQQQLVRPLYLVRRFEFEFRLASLSVVMFHLRSGGDDDDDDKDDKVLHLVEVYHIRDPILRAVLGTILDMSHWLLTIKRRIWNSQTRPWQQSQKQQ